MFFEKDTDTDFYLKIVDKFALELQEIFNIRYENLPQSWKLWKKANNKSVKFRSYTLNEKILLKSKYIKIKYNQNLKAKLFGLFYMLQLWKNMPINLKY